MRSLVVLVLVLLSSSYRVATADDDLAKADALFAEAQELKAAGNLVDACKKYDEALQYNRSAVGTLLNVGLCNEQAGKYATAVTYYTQARDLAREHSFVEHQTAAEERLAVALPLVAHLAIVFAEKAASMKLVIDEQIVALDKSGDIPVDPGRHHVVVTAPGRVPYETYVDVEKSGRKSVSVPRLDYPVTVTSNSRKTVGKILTYSGAGLVATGIGIGVYAFAKYGGQVGDGKNCRDTSPPSCNPEGLRNIDDARTFGTFGTIVGISGLAVLGAGAYLWFFGPTSSEERGVVLVPTVEPDVAGVSAIGRF